MSTRREFEMSEADLDVLLKASSQTRYMVFVGHTPIDPKVIANDAWAALGVKLGFDSTTVQPVAGKGDRFFTARPMYTGENR